MKSFVWHEMKKSLLKNTKICILSALAFALLCVAVSVCLDNYIESVSLNRAIEESYGGNTFFKIIVNGDDAKLEQFFSEENVETIRSFFEEMADSDDFEYRWAKTDIVQFFNPDDESYGKSDFPAHPDSCVYGYDDPYIWEESDYALSLNAILADRLFGTEPTMSLSSGRWFEAEEFYVESSEGIHLPCILGHEYEGLYEVGDKIPYAHIGTLENITLDIVGILNEGSYFWDNNDDKINLDRYIALPLPEIGEGFPVMDGDAGYSELYLRAYDSDRIMNCRIICRTEDAEKVKSEVNALCSRMGLYEIRLSDETESASKDLKESREVVRTNLITVIFIIAVSLVVYAIQMNYKLIRERRKYSVLKLSGMTKKQLFVIMMADSLLMFALADVVFTAVWLVNMILGDNSFATLSWYIFPVMLALELFILAGMGIYGTVKITHMSDLSAALRENE